MSGSIHINFNNFNLGALLSTASAEMRSSPWFAGNSTTTVSGHQPSQHNHSDKNNKNDSKQSCRNTRNWNDMNRRLDKLTMISVRQTRWTSLIKIFVARCCCCLHWNFALKLMRSLFDECAHRVRWDPHKLHPVVKPVLLLMCIVPYPAFAVHPSLANA